MAKPVWSEDQRQTALENLIHAVEEAFDEEIDRFSACDIMAKLSAVVMYSALTAEADKVPPELLFAGIEGCAGQLRNELHGLVELHSFTTHATVPCSTTIH